MCCVSGTTMSTSFQSIIFCAPRRRTLIAHRASANYRLAGTGEISFPLLVSYSVTVVFLDRNVVSLSSFPALISDTPTTRRRYARQRRDGVETYRRCIWQSAFRLAKINAFACTAFASGKRGSGNAFGSTNLRR